MPGTLRQPLALDLYVVLSEVLESFAYLPVQPLNGPQPDLALSYHAAMPGGRSWMVLRGSAELARQLAEASTGGADEGLDDDAFVELCNISASHLALRLANGAKGPWTAFVPVPGLPAGQIQALQLLDVNGLPLEASFWTAA